MTLITVSSLDTVRIEVLGESRAVSLPAESVLVFYEVIKYCHLQGKGISIRYHGDIWEAQVDEMYGAGESIWEALTALEISLQTGG